MVSVSDSIKGVTSWDVLTGHLVLAQENRIFHSTSLTDFSDLSIDSIVTIPLITWMTSNTSITLVRGTTYGQNALVFCESVVESASL